MNVKNTLIFLISFMLSVGSFSAMARLGGLDSGCLSIIRGNFNTLSLNASGSITVNHNSGHPYTTEQLKALNDAIAIFNAMTSDIDKAITAVNNLTAGHVVATTFDVSGTSVATAINTLKQDMFVVAVSGVLAPQVVTQIRGVSSLNFGNISTYLDKILSPTTAAAPFCSIQAIF